MKRASVSWDATRLSSHWLHDLGWADLSEPRFLHWPSLPRAPSTTRILAVHSYYGSRPSTAAGHREWLTPAPQLIQSRSDNPDAAWGLSSEMPPSAEVCGGRGY